MLKTTAKTKQRKNPPLTSGKPHSRCMNRGYLLGSTSKSHGGALRVERTRVFDFSRTGG